MSDFPSHSNFDRPSFDPPWESLDRQIIRVERIVGIMMICFFGLLGACGFGIAIWGYGIPVFGYLGLGLTTAFFLWIGFSILIWHDPVWRFQTTNWRELPIGLEIRRGILWRHHIMIPRVRIQHTDVLRGPLMRRYHLATLIVNTAGTHHYSIELAGLHESVATSLRQSLLPLSVQEDEPLLSREPKGSLLLNDEEGIETIPSHRDSTTSLKEETNSYNNSEDSPPVLTDSVGTSANKLCATPPCRTQSTPSPESSDRVDSQVTDSMPEEKSEFQLESNNAIRIARKSDRPSTE